MLSPLRTEKITPANEISIVYAIRRETALYFLRALNKFDNLAQLLALLNTSVVDLIVIVSE